MITLIIPTMNRSDFLIRLLRYYWALDFQGCICIGDSSDAVHVGRTKRAIKTFQAKLNIVYREYPGINNSECLKRLLELVSTPHVAFIADDDFLVPAALERCALFLDSHPDYSAVHGLGVTVRLQSSGAYGQVASVAHYRQPVIEGESASQRLLDHLSNYSVTLFSVHRVESWREMYKDISLLTDIRFTELLPCCLSVILGKVKELDCFYLVRQGHPQRYLLPGKAEWTASPNFLLSYQVFCDCLAKELARQDSVSLDKVQEAVKQAFSSYLTNSFVEPWQSRYGLPRLLRVAGVIPGARQVWRASRRALRSLNLVGQDEIPLAALLSSSSPYHTDFMPVYQAVTEVPAEFPEERT